jgi:hypothetical protein
MKRRARLLRRRLLSALLLAAVLLLLAGGMSLAQGQNPAEAADAAATWLVATHQNDDGGYASFSSGTGQAPSDVAGTVDALLALVAAGKPVESSLAFLESQPEEVQAFLAQSGGSAGKLVLALAAAGADVDGFAGLNPVSALQEQFATEGNANVVDPYNQALAILGLVAAGEPVPAGALAWLEERQETDGELSGSWDDGYGTAGNIDATAMAIMALHAGGAAPSSAALAMAGEFLERVQLDSGGWGYAPGMPESANSTALALQARSALRADVGDAMAALIAWQQPSGAFAADFGDGPFDDFFTTLQAIPALTGQPYPLVGGNAATQAAGASSHAQAERQQTNPIFAWILIALALLGAAAVVFWARSGKGL